MSEFGPNEPREELQPSFRSLLLFANPLAIILLAARVISAALSEALNATIIPLMAVLGFAAKVFSFVREAD